MTHAPLDAPSSAGPVDPGTAENHPEQDAGLWSPSEMMLDWLVIVLGAALLLSGIAQSQPLLSANDRSRWGTVWTLVERGTFVIDEIENQSGWSTIDKVRVEGHFYSSKPPLLTTMAAGLYWGLKHGFGFDLLTDTENTTRVILLLLNGLPTVMAFLLFATMLKEAGIAALPRMVTTGVFCFGTLVTGYATTLNNHSPAAVTAVFTMVSTMRLLREPSPRPRDLFGAGLWGALTACFELPAALLGASVFMLAARRDLRKTLIWLIPGALIPIAGHVATNWMATGDWKPFYAAYGTSAYLYEVDGIPSYWMQPRGLDQNLDSTPVYLLHCLIGHHGVFSLTPVFLLTAFCWCRRQWIKSSPLRTMIILGAFLFWAVLGFYLTRTQNYNYGGNSYGLRWMLWLTPFLLTGMVPALERIGRNRLATVVMLLLIGISTASSAAAARNPWSASWLFRQMERAGWIDYSDPLPPHPKEQLMCRFPRLAGYENPGDWVEFRSTGTGSDRFHRKQDRFRLTLQERVVRDERQIDIIDIEWNAHRPDFIHVVVEIDVEDFRAGKAPAQFLRAFHSKETSFVSLRILETMLQGVPLPRQYRYGVERYLRLPVRKNAFRTLRAAAEVVGAISPGAPRLRHRCDLWVSEEIPFGTARYEVAEYGAETGELITKRTLEVARFGRKKPPADE